MIEELGGFGGGEPEIGGAQFGQLAASAQMGQGELRIFAGGDDQVHLGRHVLEQKGEGRVNGWGFDNVVVIEDEAEIVWERRDVVDEGR